MLWRGVVIFFTFRPSDLITTLNFVLMDNFCPCFDKICILLNIWFSLRSLFITFFIYMISSKQLKGQINLNAVALIVINLMHMYIEQVKKYYQCTQNTKKIWFYQIAVYKFIVLKSVNYQQLLDIILGSNIEKKLGTNIQN